MSALPPAARIAVGVGLAGSAWCAGAIMSCSILAVPALTDPNLPAAAAAHASCIWHNLYNRGKSTVPPIAISTAAAFAYATYAIPNPFSLKLIQRSRNLLAVAGLFTVAIVPFTLLLMKSTNDALHAKALAVQERSRKGLDTLLDDGTRELLSNWNILNFVRGIFPLAATGFGISAVLF
ncbi:hypothetical protein GGU11DRAFT_693308 [Lentinula aff. detonsa]|nr:hypothetical protein GGU11DRAFT_693308 [Lentinula aff. detonsa]